MKREIIIYKENDVYELPVTLVNTIEEASLFIGCTPRALYKNMHIYGVMKANGYVLELVQKEEVKI